MKKKNLTFIIIVVIIAAAIIGILIKNKKTLDKRAAITSEIVVTEIPVYTMTLKPRTFDQNLVKVGTLIPHKEADINATVAGRLTSIKFDLGSQVSQGSHLASIDNKQIMLNIQAAELQRDQAERDYIRYKALYEGDAAPEVNYQNAKLQYDNAVTQIETLRKQLSDFNVKAPISGIVISKMKEPGEYVGPGAVLGHIVDISSLKVKVKVSENDVYTMNVGQPVNITTDIYPGINFEGKITFISAKGDEGHNYDVEITMKNNSKEYPLKAGTFANVDFIKQSSASIYAIPRAALVESLKNPYVYVVVDEIIEVRQVVLGKEIGEYIEVLDGLKENDVIVTSGMINIKPGIKVRAMSTDSANQ